MLPALASLIAVQDLDTAAETARRRLTELPAVERQLEDRLVAARLDVEAAQQRLQANHDARRDLEKEVAVVDGRLARFDDHKAAVKTNQEFTALLHEIETARSSKDSIEERILGLMEAADELAAVIAEAEQALATAHDDVETGRAAIAAERSTLEREAARLAAERATQATALDAATLARYEQLLKQRRMLAVAPLQGDVCSACHVKLRPVVTQYVRRNEALVACDSCQRILYAPAQPAVADDAAPAPA